MPLDIRLLGTALVQHRSLGIETVPGRGVERLLAHLLLARHHTSMRDRLLADLWPDHDEPRARACLSTSLWRLRACLEPDGVKRGRYLAARRTGEIQILLSDEDVADVVRVSAVCDAIAHGRHDGDRAPDLTREAAALESYRGDLLEGHFDDWSLSQREQLRHRYLEALTLHAERAARRGELELAIEQAERILALEPLREEIHRLLMRCHAANGHAAAAVRQYERCRASLRAELATDPMPETACLARTIRDAGGAELAAPSGVGRDALREILHALDDARAQLTRLLGGSPINTERESAESR